MSLFLFHFQFAQLIVPYPKSVALEDTSRMPCEVNSNADSEFDLRAGGFYTRLVFTLTFMLSKMSHGSPPAAFGEIQEGNAEGFPRCP